MSARASALTASRSKPAAATSIEGVLERVTYANDENAWSAVKLVVTGKTDTVLAHHVLKALPLPCQLVLVGDIDQLPSVGLARCSATSSGRASPTWCACGTSSAKGPKASSSSTPTG